MKRWTTAEHQKLLDLWRADTPSGIIALRLGRDVKTVRAYIQWQRGKGEHGLALRRKAGRRTEKLVAPEAGYVATSAVPPAIIYDRFGQPTGWIIDPATHTRRRA